MLCWVKSRRRIARKKHRNEKNERRRADYKREKMRESTKKKQTCQKRQVCKKRRYVGLQRFGIVNQRIDVITVVLDAVVEIGQQLAVYVVVEEQFLQLGG